MGNQFFGQKGHLAGAAVVSGVLQLGEVFLHLGQVVAQPRAAVGEQGDVEPRLRDRGVAARSDFGRQRRDLLRQHL